jgi:UMF1 family MFS transporter
MGKPMSTPKTEFRGRKTIWSWALYDCANSAFATVVISGFFPVFFKNYWSTGIDPTVSTFHLGVTNSIASIVIVVLAPLLGAMADAGGRRKHFLLFFALMGITMTVGLRFLGEGEWQAAALVYGLAVVGFSGGNIFYDALLIDVTEKSRLDRVSALGFAVGYLGGGLLFSLNVVMTQRPEWFGLESIDQAIRVSFVLVGCWWAVFSIPLFLFVKERPAAVEKTTLLEMGTVGVQQLVRTYKHIRELRMVALFLVAYWLYIDGVDTVIRMAVDYGMSLGFNSGQLVLALLLTQFVAFPAAIVFGHVGERIGAKSGILIAIAVYMGITVWAYFVNRPAEFYGIAMAIGLVQGGVQSLSRSFYARIIPRDKSAEFFGFYNMLGKFAAVIGPVLVGVVSIMTENPRYSILSLLVLFVGGALVLWRVDEEEGQRAAIAMERDLNPTA